MVPGGVSWPKPHRPARCSTSSRSLDTKELPLQSPNEQSVKVTIDGEFEMYLIWDPRYAPRVALGKVEWDGVGRLNLSTLSGYYLL